MAHRHFSALAPRWERRRAPPLSARTAIRELEPMRSRPTALSSHPSRRLQLLDLGTELLVIHQHVQQPLEPLCPARTAPPPRQRGRPTSVGARQPRRCRRSGRRRGGARPAARRRRWQDAEEEEGGQRHRRMRAFRAKCPARPVERQRSRTTVPRHSPRTSRHARTARLGPRRGDNGPQQVGEGSHRALVKAFTHHVLGGEVVVRVSAR